MEKMAKLKLYKDFIKSYRGNKYPENIDPNKDFGLYPRCMLSMQMCNEREVEYLPMEELKDLTKEFEVYLKWQYFLDEPYFKVEAKVT